MSYSVDVAASMPVRTRARPSADAPRAADTSSAMNSKERRHPPAKRARKAINCEPCRSSKLKCDRNRPCSSCVLRGTAAFCYQGQDSNVPVLIDGLRPSIDALSEISRIRQSLSLLELQFKDNTDAHSTYTMPSSSTVSPSPTHRPSSSLRSFSSGSVGQHLIGPSSSTPSPSSSGNVGILNIPGKLGYPGLGGLYAGSTSPASNFIANSDSENFDYTYRPYSPLDREGSAAFPENPRGSPASGGAQYDEDLIALLPPIEIVDQLIAYYFEYCNWIYRYVNEEALLGGWARYKAGQDGDRVVLGTVYIIIAIAVCYLPPEHCLRSQVTSTPEELARTYHAVMRKALQRHRESAESVTRTYTLSLVELLLVESHYLTFAKEDPETIWSRAGELVSIGTAMGLHCEPSKMQHEPCAAERRRWAWWHIILFERWQAFVFGRPLRVASHHCYTELPTYGGTVQDKSGHVYLTNVALLRLAYILGDIMDDAVSFRTVSYPSVQEKDRLLDDWYDSLPSDLPLDDFTLAQSLASTEIHTRRNAVQSVVLRCAFYHIRFTLHRPYLKVPQSLHMAVTAASGLITLFSQAYTTAAVPGHFHWGHFHVFSAAVFLSFQLITDPSHPLACSIRQQIRKALGLLEFCRTLPVVEKALMVLQTLIPLYREELTGAPPEERAQKKAEVLKAARTLAFPYQDQPYSRNTGSPSYRPFTPSVVVAGSSDTATKVKGSLTLPMTTAPLGWQAQMTTSPLQAYQQRSMSVPSLPQHITIPRPAHPHMQVPLSPGRIHSAPEMDQMNVMSVNLVPQQCTSCYDLAMPSSATPTMAAHAMQQTVRTAATQQPLPHHAQPLEENQHMARMHPADDGSMWGASGNFGNGEWARFLDVIHRREDPDSGLEPSP